MIVKTALEDFVWGTSGLSHPDPKLVYDVYQFIRELILDSHLYMTKVIGFYVKNRTMRSKSGTYIARNVQIGESYAEMAVKLTDKLFVSVSGNDLNIGMECGVVRAADCKTALGNGKLFYTNDEICRVINGECILCLKLQTNCGYRDMRQNSAELPSEYFPMNTYFNIYDYVRVLPMLDGDTHIRLKFCNGMDVETLKLLLVQYCNMVSSELVNEEELAWIYSFEQ